jgi:4-diphosphocytidyl-2-C-methyl-D-erythritol kinase
MPERTVDPVSALVSAAASKVESARAKINLALHVLDRRADGYHVLDSLVVFAQVADRLTIFGVDEGFIDLAVDGPFAEDLLATTAPDDNLVLAVARGLAEVYPDRSAGGVRLHLSKQLPVAAGLGGGSADAAAALRLLNRLWRLDLSHHQLAHLGLSLGADVPVCLLSRPARVQDIGETITPVSGIPAMTVVLVNPGVAVSTRRVFRRLERTEGLPLPPIPEPAGSLMEFVFWLRKTRNDLFAPASKEAPAIEKAVRALAADPDCLFARMSGSGATVFGIFMSNEAADRAAARLHAAEPHWWVAVTRTDGS